MICRHPRTNRLDFGSDQVKVTKRSKMYFCHNVLSFRLIHMKPTPKCSLFNSLSSDMVTNVALARYALYQVPVLVFVVLNPDKIERKKDIKTHTKS